MGFGYDDVGQFGDRRAAEDWAKRNGIDPRDLHLRDTPTGVEAGVRKSASGNGRFDDSAGNRRDGFLR